MAREGPGETLTLFAVTAPGLEGLVAAELEALGMAGVPESGGVGWQGTLDQLYAANLWLRTASRVVVRIGEFRARTFFELERHAARVPWERYLEPGTAVRLRVTARKSKLYHEGAIAERLVRAIEQRAGPLASVAAAKDGEEAGEAQIFIIRFLHDRCTVSADTSGALLHQRGYRQAVAKAPLRETLAAAALVAGGWRSDAPLLDPMCGAGTIPIEAALLARRIAPGLASAGRLPRPFAFERWPGFERGVWEARVERARAGILPAVGVPILGSDRDAGAIEAAHANAARAGVEGDLSLEVRPLSAVEPPPGPGWLVTNPPYGVRVGESAPLRNLYAALGRLARSALPGWTVVMLSADRKLERQTGLRMEERLRTSNGGIPVRLMAGRVEEA